MKPDRRYIPNQHSVLLLQPVEPTKAMPKNSKGGSVRIAAAQQQPQQPQPQPQQPQQQQPRPPQPQQQMAAQVRHQGRNRDNRGPGDVTYCCVPSNCPNADEPIYLNDPGDAVRVACNNDACTLHILMHAECFVQWEQHVLAYLRSCGRARSWSEKQRLQNLWTKKGYDLAYKACDCKCGRGHLRKDLDFLTPAKTEESKRVKKHKKKQAAAEKASILTQKVPMVNHPPANTPGNNAIIRQQQLQQQQLQLQHLQQLQQLPLQPLTAVHAGMRPQLRVRTSSFSSTGSSPPSSAGTPPMTPGKKGKFDFFADHDQAAAGNIFHRRTDFSVFNMLPRHQQNPYHIKMEDEGPHGNDETRCFVLTNLSTHQVTCARCVVCNVGLPVFDKYPLIDGTFFLSPQRYNTDMQVLFDSKMLYLNAICMRCLEGSGKMDLRCRACRSRWHGRTLVIGTMYSYDIFAAVPCCATRLSCKNCRRSILDPDCPFQFFSEYSKAILCPHCGAEDHHFIKPIEDSFTVKSPIRLC